MEVVGTVAALISLTKEVAGASDSLIRRFRNAPKELIQLHNQLSLILLQVNYIGGFGPQNEQISLLPTYDVQVLLHTMQIAKNEITTIQHELGA